MQKQKLAEINAFGRRIGEGHPCAKLTDRDVEQILYLRFEAGLSYRQIARKFDDGVSVSASMVYYICKGYRRGQLPAGYKRVHSKD